MKKYKAVLFDFDGTILDTNGYIINSWEYASKKLFGKMIFDVDYLAGHFGTPLEFAVGETIKKYNIEGISVEDLCALYREYQQTNPTKIGVPFEGVPELLAALKERGIKVGVVTSRTKHSTVAALALNDIDKYFDVIIAVEDTEIHKPLPEPALICCSRMGVDPEDALMVGDSKWDIACGNNAGCGSALVGWSFAQKPEGLEGVEKPDYVIAKAGDILDLV